MKNKKIVFSLRYRSNKNPNDYSIAMTYWYGVLDRLGYEVLYYDYDGYDIDDLYNTIKEFKADYFIHTNYLVGVHKEFDKIRELCKVFLLSTDAYRFHDSNLKYWIPFVDGIINFEGVKEWYLRDGLPEKGFLKMKWGFNPNMMCTEDIDNKSINIQHYGGLHGGRDHKILQFNQLGHNITQESFISYSEMKKNLARSKYSLCFSSNAIGTRNELKGRVIEIPSQAILLTEPAPELDTYFNNDEIIIFNSVEEAVNRINSITEDEYNIILKKGQKALWNRNTAYHEWNKILPLMDPDYIQIKPIDIIKKYHNEYYKG
jgi:hypothetical protein|tara:strand:+ start:6284 stop:7234 length:951 start_codon:yes stop_codon:yes gene_type:complete